MRFSRQSRMRMHSEMRADSLSDIMFFLMLFFLIMSTLVSPSVIKLVLPKTQAGQTVSKNNFTLSIDANKNYYLNDKPVSVDNLAAELAAKAGADKDATCVIRADNTLPVQVIVDVISIGNKEKIKMILATDKK
ncbi:MAG: biopolymer transporter ExbD [Chitinophagales bacterium]